MKTIVTPLLLVLAVAGCSVIACLRGRVLWDSDQAIVGLAARDILHHGETPVFYSGQEFLGTAETYWVALAFALFSESVWSYRIATGLVLVLTVLVVWAYSREAYGGRAGLIAGLYLSFGPPFLFYRTLAGGGYATILLIGAAVLFLLVRAERRAGEGLSPTFQIVGVAFLLGAGFWTSYLSFAYVCGAVVAFFSGTARRRITAFVAISSVAAFLAGSLPWWLRNLQSGWASLGSNELATSRLADLPTKVASLSREGLPTLFGALPFRTGKYIFPGAALVSWTFVAVILWHASKSSLFSGRTLSAYTSRALLAVAISAPILALTIARTDFTEPRYLEAMYLAMASLFGSIAAGRGAVWFRAAVVSFAVALNIGGHLREPRRADAGFLAERGSDWPVVQQLRSRRIEAIYSSYWTAYVLTFASDSSIVATPFGRWNLTRRPQDRAWVDASASPGILLEGEEAALLERMLLRSHVPFQRDRIDEMTLFWNLPPQSLAGLRTCLCIPASIHG
jgi:4-amino-4-deoxy-L-arabinose transferase-like glycosyltransferase